MKKIYLLPFLLISACTTSKSDNHSYTYIHNLNASSEPEKKSNRTQDNSEYVGDDAPFYNRGMDKRPSAVISDKPNAGQREPIMYNNYYYPPIDGFGFTPTVRRHLMYGETRY